MIFNCFICADTIIADKYNFSIFICADTIIADKYDFTDAIF